MYVLCSALSMSDDAALQCHGGLRWSAPEFDDDDFNPIRPLKVGMQMSVYYVRGRRFCILPHKHILNQADPCTWLPAAEWGFIRRFTVDVLSGCHQFCPDAEGHAMVCGTGIMLKSQSRSSVDESQPSDHPYLVIGPYLVEIMTDYYPKDEEFELISYLNLMCETHRFVKKLPGQEAVHGWFPQEVSLPSMDSYGSDPYEWTDISPAQDPTVTVSDQDHDNT